MLPSQMCFQSLTHCTYQTVASNPVLISPFLLYPNGHSIHKFPPIRLIRPKDTLILWGRPCPMISFLGNHLPKLLTFVLRFASLVASTDCFYCEWFLTPMLHKPTKNKELVCLLRSVFLQPALESTTGQTMKCRFLPLLHWPLFLKAEATSIFIYSQWFRLMLNNCYFTQQIQTVQVVENLTAIITDKGLLRSYKVITVIPNPKV